MIAYIVRRLLLMIPTMFGIMLVAFVVIQFAPGGPIEQAQPALATVAVLVVAARAADVAVPCQELIGMLTKAFSGKGGGKPDLAQCGGLQASSDQVLGAVREWLAARA